MTGADGTLDFTSDAEDDLRLIEHHLRRAYQEFGESPFQAAGHAELRVNGLIDTAERLVSAPYCGATHDDLMPDLRLLALGGGFL